MTLYFQRHDGQAVTCDDFAQAIADANPGSALATRLRRSSSAGTRRPARRGSARAAATTPPARSYTLTLAQSSAPTPGQPSKQPFVIPVAMGLLGADGATAAAARGEPPRRRARAGARRGRARLCTFVNVDAEPVPSLLRGFSAPVLLDDGLTDAQLLVLLAHDSDPFNRWEAGQRLALEPPAGRDRAAARRRCSTTRFVDGACAACCATRRSTPRSRSWC